MLFRPLGVPRGTPSGRFPLFFRVFGFRGVSYRAAILRRQAPHLALTRRVADVRVVPENRRIDVAHPFPDDRLRYVLRGGPANKCVPECVDMARQAQSLGDAFERRQQLPFIEAPPWLGIPTLMPQGVEHLEEQRELAKEI